MSVFPDWQRYAVHQRRPATGCIPACYEILLRAADFTGIDYGSFQDDFDLDQHGGNPRNHFVPIAEAVKRRYPFVEFICESFAQREDRQGDGDKKLARVEEFIIHRRPVVVSLANAPFGGRGWHIMVVVDATEDYLTLLKSVDINGVAETLPISKEDLVSIHNTYPGGNEIAYLASTKYDL